MSLAGFQRRRRELVNQINENEPKKVSGSDDNNTRKSEKRTTTKRKSKG